MTELNDFKKIKAIIFDFDDTLVDEAHWIRSRWEKAIDFAEKELGIVGFGEQFWKVFDEKGPGYQQHVNDALSNLNQIGEKVKPIVNNFLSQKIEEKLLPKVKACLDSLKGRFKLGIVTNGREEIQLKRIRNAGISSYFDAIVCAFDIPKPEFHPYRECLDKLGVVPEEAVYVSHDLIADLKGARDLGMSTVLLDMTGKSKEKDADLKIKSYVDLIEAAEERGTDLKKKGILIVGAGLLQIAAIEKAKELGYYVYITDMNVDSEVARMADEAFAISTKDVDGHAELAKRFKEEGKIEAVYTQGCDAEYTVAIAACAAGLPGIDPGAALNCNDKIKMRTILNDVDFVRFSHAKDIEEAAKAVREVGFPCVIKPCDNSASRGVKILHDESEIEDAFNEAKDNCFLRKEVIVEKFLDGLEYSVDTVMYKGKLYPAGISDRQFRPKKKYAVQVGSMTPSLLPEEIQKKTYELMEKAAKALKIEDGAFKGDLIIVGGEPKIIEVTARTSGGFDSQYRKPYSFGIDIIKATMDIAMGKELDPLDLVPKWIKWSKTTSVFPEPGVIKSISGIDKLEKIKGVKNVFHSMKVGDVVEDYKHCANRTNYIIIVADTYEKLNRLEDEVHETLKIQTEKKTK